MKDFRGTELNFGDHVAVAMCGGSYATYMQEYIVLGSCKRGGYNCLVLESAKQTTPGGWPSYCSWNRTIVKAEHKVVKIS